MMVAYILNGVRMLKAYCYRLYPNKAQTEMLALHFGHTRYVYNWALKFKQRYYALFGKTLSKRKLQDRLVARKKRAKYAWLNQVNSQSLLAALLNLDTAFNNFFQGRAKRPHFKSRKSNWQSYQCPQHVRVYQDNNVIDLPKIKGIKAVIHRQFAGIIKTCTIKKSPSGHYYISVLVEDTKPLPSKAPVKPETTMGIDVGIKDFVVMSDGNKLDNHRYLQQSLIKLNKAQRQLSRKQKRSNNRDKHRLLVAKLHEKVAKRRNAYHHKVANLLLDDNQVNTVAFEDLHIKGMIKNRRLSRHIADVAWSRFIDIVRYKADWLGKNVIFCGRYQPSSKQCECGYLNKALKLSDRAWDCPVCKAANDRDILAANNIKKFALADALG